MNKTITVSDDTFELIKDQLNEEEKVDITNLDDFIGQKLYIRTVTYHLVGKVVNRIANLFELEDASWVADSGRFMNAIKEGTLDEVEPVGQAFVNMNSVVDMFPWTYDLPDKQS